ncbi:MAG: TIGR04372 family glycosyltransferase [Alphaproteobacteria bacterium]
MVSAGKPFHFVLAVWGDDYIATLLDLALPSFLAPGNIPTCAAEHQVAFYIYTRPEDAPAIEAHAAWQELSRVCEARIVPVLTADQFDRPNRYAVMSFCHQLAIIAARRAGAVLSLLGPDCVIADGALQFGIEKVDAGYKAVMITGPRGEMETIAPILMGRWRSKGSNAIAIPPRALMQLLIDRPHPISQRLFWDATDFSHIPSAVYFRAGSSGMLAKHFHLHPLFIDLSNAPVSIEETAGTVDGPLLHLAKIEASQIYTVVDSDEMAIIELSRRAHDWMGGSPTPSPAWRVARWMIQGAEPAHRRNFLDHTMRFVGEGSVDWHAAERVMTRRLRGLEAAIHMSLNHPALFERMLNGAASGLRLVDNLRQPAKVSFKLRSLLISILMFCQSRIAPWVAQRAAWLYWPLAALCRRANIRFLINMPAGMGHNTSELDRYLRHRLGQAPPLPHRVVLFRDPNQIHRDSAKLYRRHFWWIPTSRLIYCLLLPLPMRYRDLTIDGGMSRLKWQLREEDLSYSRPVPGQTYLHQISKEAGLGVWRDYFRLRAATPNVYPLSDNIGIDADLLAFLGGKAEKLALFHMKQHLSNATGAATEAADYLPAMRYLQTLGYNLVFVGREIMPREFAEIGVLNYAESPLASYRHDLQLFNEASVAVTGGSGIAYLPDCLGVPYVYANSWHIGMPMCSPYCVMTPTLVQESSSGRLLSFTEQAELYWSMPDDGHESFPQGKYRAINADGSEILEAVKEALSLKTEWRPLDELQSRYLKADERGLLPVTGARVSAHFVAKHANLLPSGDADVANAVRL